MKNASPQSFLALLGTPPGWCPHPAIFLRKATRRPVARRHAHRMFLCACAATLATLALAEKASAEEASPTAVASPNGGAPTVRCLMPVQIRDTEVLSERHIVFYTPGNGHYLIEFQEACSGLHKDGSFRFQSHGDGYCQHDTLQPLTLSSPGSGFWGTPCPIPAFRPITEAELEALKSHTAPNE